MKPKYLLLFLLFCVFFLLCSCDLLRDKAYEIVSWTPGEAYHSNTERINISVLFSLDSDKARTEQAFTLTEDGRALQGYFSWNGKRLNFTPASPLEVNRDYVLSIGTGAQDKKGLSLEKKFEVSFTTREPGNKPLVVGVYPAFEEFLSESREEFRIMFASPVTLGSCMDFISFNPSTQGSWRLQDNDMTAVFTPRDPWQYGIAYKAKIDSTFKGVSGSILGAEYNTVFYYGIDRLKPELLNVYAVYTDALNNEILSDEINISKIGPGEPLFHFSDEYKGFEKTSSLVLHFSKAIEVNGLRNLINTEPHALFNIETAPGFSKKIVLSLIESAEWGSPILFHLGSGIKDIYGNTSEDEYLFKINFNGAMSKPPALVGIRIPMRPGETDQHPIVYKIGELFKDLPVITGEGSYPYETKVSTWIELYFDTAPSANVDPFSLMSLFRVDSTNQALTFSPRDIISENFTMHSPVPEWENYQRIEVQGLLTNTIYTGIVTFRIPPGLKDLNGNISKEDFRISLVK